MSIIRRIRSKTSGSMVLFVMSIPVKASSLSPASPMEATASNAATNWRGPHLRRHDRLDGGYHLVRFECPREPKGLVKGFLGSVWVPNSEPGRGAFPKVLAPPTSAVFGETRLSSPEQRLEGGIPVVHLGLDPPNLERKLKRIVVGRTCACCSRRGRVACIRSALAIVQGSLNA